MLKNIYTFTEKSISRSFCLLGSLLCLVLFSTLLPTSIATTYASSAPASPVQVSNIPPAIRVPGNEKLVVTAQVKQGYQIYGCSAQGSWVLQGPLSILITPHGEKILYSSGPRWQLNGGSTIQGQVVATAPHFPNIPQVLFKITAHSGSASWLTHINYVQQLNTSGGGLSIHCDPTAKNRYAAVPYTATYQFWQPK